MSDYDIMTKDDNCMSEICYMRPEDSMSYEQIANPSKCYNYIDNGLHLNCQMSMTEPINSKLAGFEYNSGKKMWISKWEDGSWKNKKIPIGKFKGEPLKSIYHNFAYCQWIKDNFDFNMSIYKNRSYEEMSALYFMLFHSKRYKK